MKKKKPLRSKITIYLLLFAGGLVVLLLVFQLVLLEPMYERYKKEEVKRAGDAVASALATYEGQDLENAIFSISAENDTCVRVIGESSDFTTGNMGCVLYRMSDHEVMAEAQKASDAGNSYLDTFDNHIDPPGGVKDDDGSSGSDMQGLLYTVLVDVGGVTKIVMTSTTLTPVNATTSTLRTQIWYIGVIVIVAMLLLSWWMNHQIAKPLAAINTEAKKLADGVYGGARENLNYLEASELDTTLQKAAVDIRKAEKERRDLLSNVSHDLRTPLTMINGFAKMMVELPDQKTEENLQVIIDESDRLTVLVNDLLDLSRLQANRITLHPEVFNLSELLEKELRKYEIYKVEDGFNFETDIAPDLYVYADSKRIAQVFNNFVINAINYSGNSRRILIRAESRPDKAHVEIQDFGEGIAPEQQKDIWDRYYKIDRTHVRQSNGSGLGLSIVKQLLDLHHARYGVKSKPEEGSTFWFELDLAEEDERPVKKEIPAADNKGEEAHV